MSSFTPLFPLCLCAFGWAFATTLPFVGHYVPLSSGLTAYSFLTLLGVYALARFARREYDVQGDFYMLVTNKRIILPLIGISMTMAAIGLGDYNSPFAVVIAGGMFFMAKEFKIPNWAGCACSWLGPSMFSIYLIHSHGHAWKYLNAIEDAALMHGLPLPLVYLTTACCVFTVCLALDIPRRLFLAALRRNK